MKTKINTEKAIRKFYLKYLSYKSDYDSCISEVMEIQKILDQSKLLLDEMKSIADPVVSISVSQSKHSGEIYVAKSLVRKGKKRIPVNVYLGKISKFEGGKNNDLLTKLAHDKIKLAIIKKFKLL